jgi:hypothetical protein
MVTTTAQAIIRGALLQIGVIAQGESVEASLSADAFSRLNELVDAWATQRLTQRTVTQATTGIVASQASYTVGLTGDFNIARPTFLDSCALLLTNTTPNTELPLSPMTEMAYQAIAQKTLTNSQPTSWYYEASSPLGTITLWPVPTDASNDLVIYVSDQLAAFTTQTASVTLTPGYARALRLALAVEMAPECGRAVSDQLRFMAADALGDLKRLNVSMADLSMDPALTVTSQGGYNIYTDQGA